MDNMGEPNAGLSLGDMALPIALIVIVFGIAVLFG